MHMSCCGEGPWRSAGERRFCTATMTVVSTKGEVKRRRRWRREKRREARPKGNGGEKSGGRADQLEFPKF